MFCPEKVFLCPAHMDMDLLSGVWYIAVSIIFHLVPVKFCGVPNKTCVIACCCAVSIFCHCVHTGNRSTCVCVCVCVCVLFFFLSLPSLFVVFFCLLLLFVTCVGVCSYV